MKASAIRIAASVGRKALGHMLILRLLKSRHPAPGKVCKPRGPAIRLDPVQLFPLDCDVSQALLRGPPEKFFMPGLKIPISQSACKPTIHAVNNIKAGGN